jgi:hypothetical protein
LLGSCVLLGKDEVFEKELAIYVRRFPEREAAFGGEKLLVADSEERKSFRGAAVTSVTRLWGWGPPATIFRVENFETEATMTSEPSSILRRCRIFAGMTTVPRLPTFVASRLAVSTASRFFLALISALTVILNFRMFDNSTVVYTPSCHRSTFRSGFSWG